jgi:hypothetical protein
MMAICLAHISAADVAAVMRDRPAWNGGRDGP